MSGTAAALVLAGTWSVVPARGFAQAEGEGVIKAFPPLPPDMEGLQLEDTPDVPIPSGSLASLRGTAQPLPEEIETAKEILQGAPYNTRPITVAEYFERVGEGRVKPDWAPYVRGWPIRYNPVIVQFFKATRTDPLSPGNGGDFTPWCAAFVNWCIARALSTTAEINFDKNGDMTFDKALLDKGSGSAGSGSFRCWPSPQSNASDPSPGDVIVWELEGTGGLTCSGQGHVAFLREIGSDGRFLALGGNQRDPETRQNAVVTKPIGAPFTEPPEAFSAQSRSGRFEQPSSFADALLAIAPLPRRTLWLYPLLRQAGIETHTAR